MGLLPVRTTQEQPRSSYGWKESGQTEDHVLVALVESAALRAVNQYIATASSVVSSGSYDPNFDSPSPRATRQPVETAQAAVPSPWTAHTDSQGRCYYHQPDTGQTSWFRPHSLGADAGLVPQERNSPQGEPARDRNASPEVPSHCVVVGRCAWL